MEGMSEEKCALVAELVRVLEMVRQLDAHMAGQQRQQGGGGRGAAAGGEQRCRALVCTMRDSIDRAVHMAMSSCAGGQPESPPSGRDGSPRSAGSDQAGDFRGRGNAAGQCKKRKTLPKWSTQVRVSAVQDVTPLDDGLSWRKYGQKNILGAKYPRAYFRCTHRHTQSCNASKQVQRTDGDPLLFDVVYHGSHTCAQAQQGQGAAAHPSGSNQGARPASASAEHSQSQAQTTASPGLEAAAGPVLPFSLPSDRPAAGADDAGGSRLPGGGARATASPFVSPATPECLARDAPHHDAELASTTNYPLPMTEMDFMFPLDAADFLENPASYF
ncbi:putative WRKY transcription factor 53 [Panicum miliaceum]|uniref:WRKY transcription factor 53 n=1 Tax=Panicum miliaceum TaxID=4540 RepID=A0A3L6SIL2_PANMI|nr:putative WRKY transcription factor 53 [Panicum miliaceum]